MHKKAAFVFTIFVSAILFMAGCSGGSDTDDQPGSTQTITQSDALRIAVGEPVTLDPHLVTDVGSHAFTSKLFAGLVRLEAALFDLNGNFVATTPNVTQDMIEQLRRGELTVSALVVPDLATELPSPELNEDGTVSYTFRIREDAKFANGRKLTAWDVAYSLERASDPKTGSSTTELYLGDILGVIDMRLRGRIINRVSQRSGVVLIDLTRGIEVLDDLTIRLTIDAPKSYFLMKLTYPVAAVVDKVQVESAGRWTDRPNSTGPYIITKRDVGEIVMERNSNYHGDQPLIKKVTFYLSGGSSFLRFKNNELDFAGVGVGDLDLLAEVRDPSSDLGSQYFETSEMSTSYIGLNSTQPPFDDPLVRQAFAMTIDKEGLSEYVLQNLVIPAYGILPPGMPGYRADFEGLRYDPVRARELIARSSYSGKMPRVRVATSGSGSAPSVILQSIVESWRKELGVEVEIETVDYVTFLEDLKKGNFQMFSLGWVADYPDPEDFLDLKFHSERSAANNETRYRNTRVDALLELARVESDQAERIRLYQEAEDLIVQDVPWIPLFHGKTSILVNPSLCGYFPTPMGISVLRYVYFCN